MRSNYIEFKGFYTNLFFKSLAGLVVFVFFYSCFKTGFKTVNTGFVLLLIFLIWEIRLFKKKSQSKICISAYEENPLNFEWKKTLKYMYPLIIISLLIYSWFAKVILKEGAFSFSIPESDIVFYADTSKMLSLYGRENIFGISNAAAGNYHGLFPYHYFELWLNAAFSSIFKSVHPATFFLLTYPLLNLITVLGIYALIERVTKISFFHHAVALLFLFIGGMYFNEITPSTDFTLNMVESPMESYGEKYAVYYPFIICSFSFLLERQLSIALISLLALPLISFTTAPGILGGLALFSVVAIIFKRMDKNTFSRIILFIFSTGAFLYLLYYCFGNLTINHSWDKNIFAYSDISNLTYPSLKIFFAELFYRTKNSVLHLLLLYAPFIVFASLVFFKKNLNPAVKTMLFITICICCVSLLFYLSIYKMHDSWQFYTNNLALLNVFLIFVFIILLFKKSGTEKWNDITKKISLACICMLLAARACFAFYVYDKHKRNNNLFSDQYLSEIQKIKWNEKDKIKGAVLMQGKRPYFFESEVSANLTPYISFMPQLLPCFYLNTGEAKNNASEFYVFNQFMEDQKKENTFINAMQSESDFIKKYEIKFVMVSENTKISDKISEEILNVIVDSKSKQKFILLK